MLAAFYVRDKDDVHSVDNLTRNKRLVCRRAIGSEILGFFFEILRRIEAIAASLRSLFDAQSVEFRHKPLSQLGIGHTDKGGHSTKRIQ